MTRFVRCWLCISCLVSAWLGAGNLQAEELTHHFINPSFGGNPFNGPYLISNATAQRQFKANDPKGDPIKQFADDVRFSILSGVAGNISDQILGPHAKQSGNFTIGNMNIDFKRQGDQVHINIKDPSSGGQTSLDIPVPNY